jgi:dihydrofolate reductase
VSATVLYMSMSLDGFIAGPNAGPGNGLGDGGHRLHEWFLTAGDADHKAISGRLTGVNGQMVDELEIHLVPVLLGQGRRLFDNLDPEHIELVRTRILEGEAGVTHMRYRVMR